MRLGATYREQAEIVLAYRAVLHDIRDTLALSQHDARSVMLNNLISTAGGAVSILFAMNFGTSVSPEDFCRVLGVSKPEYLAMATADLLRVGRLSLLVESQFQMENGLRNLLRALRPKDTSRKFYVVVKRVLEEAGVRDLEAEQKPFRAAALLRNSMHNNGIHDGADEVITVDGEEFRFTAGKKTGARWEHICHLLTASARVIGDVLKSEPVTKLAFVQDAYAKTVAEDEGVS